MSNYRRFYRNGGSYFFTVVTYNRCHLFRSPENIQMLRESFNKIMERRPFHIDAIVVLPDHIHCIWTLPVNDSDFSTRWRLIKRNFSSRMLSPLTKNGEKKIWQRRFWEHLIRNENDLHRHMDYIHYNPVKHKYVNQPENWEYSSYNRLFSRGICHNLQETKVIEPIQALDLE